MKVALTVVMAGVIGCSKESPATNRSVWWVPVVSWHDPSLDRKVPMLLADNGIPYFLVGSRGSRIRVPYERHQQAIDLLRGAPFARNLEIHTVLAGPRAGANLPLLGIESEDISWTEILSFDPSELRVARLRDLLNTKGIECGAVSYAWEPKNAHLYVPPEEEGIARSVLRDASLRDGVAPK